MFYSLFYWPATFPSSFFLVSDDQVGGHMLLILIKSCCEDKRKDAKSKPIIHSVLSSSTVAPCDLDLLWTQTSKITSHPIYGEKQNTPSLPDSHLDRAIRMSPNGMKIISSSLVPFRRQALMQPWGRFHQPRSKSVTIFEV